MFDYTNRKIPLLRNPDYIVSVRDINVGWSGDVRASSVLRVLRMYCDLFKTGKLYFDINKEKILTQWQTESRELQRPTQM